MQEKKQLISAWVDGECSSEETLHCIQAIQTSPELLRYWQCCHSMRDIAQNRYSYSDCDSLFDNISAGIEALPPLSVALQTTSNVVQIKENKKKSTHWMPMALAATIAFMAVLFITRQPVGLLSTPQIATNQVGTSTVTQLTQLTQATDLTEKTEEPLATLDNRIAVDSEGNMYLAGHLIDRKQPSILHRGPNPYVERVDY